MLDLSAAAMAWITGALACLFAGLKFWKLVIRPSVITPIKAHFELVHESARAVKATQLELVAIKAELTQNGGKSTKDLVLQLHKDLQASGLSLARLEGLVQAILSASKEGVWISDERGNCIWLNGWFAENLGWMPHEMKGAGWKNIVHSDSRSLVYTEWDTCIREHRDFILEFDYVTKGGDKLRVHATCSPIRHNSNDLIIGHVGFVQPS